jgi:hypothetical protein
MPCKRTHHWRLGCCNLIATSYLASKHESRQHSCLVQYLGAFAGKHKPGHFIFNTVTEHT